MNNLTLEQELEPVGKYLQGLARTSKKTQRQIATDTKLSVNSVKVVLSGKPGNTKTYDIVARYLGTSFIQAVIAAHQSTKPACEASPVVAKEA